MDLKQLRTFLCVAELGSLLRAADRLRIAQPALSRQIRLLEEELQTRLFTRHGRGMALTEAGLRLKGRAEAILRQVQDARDEAIEPIHLVRGQIVLGAVPTIGDLFAARLINRFIERHPQCTFRVMTGFGGHLIDWLQRGEIDVAVLYDVNRRGNVRAEPLLTENLYLVGRGEAGHSLHRAVAFASVAQRRLILPSHRHGLRVTIEREAAAKGLFLDVPIEADSFRILHDLVVSGYGETILPLAAVRAEVAAGDLSAAPIVDPQLSRRLCLALPTDRPVPGSVRRFADHIKDEMTALVLAGEIDGHLPAI